MAKGGSLLGRVAKKAVTRVLDKVGSKVVSGMADTSADAPASRFEPKRDVYRKMQEEAQSQPEEK